MLEVKPTDFKLEPSVSRIFEEQRWTSNKDFLLNLERYKFVTRQDISHFLAGQGIFVEEVDNLKVTRFPDAYSYEQSQDILFHMDTPNQCRVFIHPFSRLDRASLEMAFPLLNLEIVAVTPFNFESLNGADFRSWNYEVLFKRIVLHCMGEEGTDFHLTVSRKNGEYIYPLRYRLGNDLVDQNFFIFDEDMNREFTTSLVAKFTGGVVGDISLNGVTTSVFDVFGDGNVTLRVTATKVLGGYKCVCRIQTLKTVNLSIPELGFGDKVSEDLLYIANKSTGFTPVTGAMRTGKNTTLFAVANHMCNREVSITEYSSPPEFSMPFEQVNYKDDLKFLTSQIKLAKKQDLDVAFVGEIPSTDVALAVRDLVVSSVHVLTTFHINRVWHLPHKLHEFYGPSYKNVFSQLNGCFTQMMYTQQCPYCTKHTHAVSEHPVLRRRQVLEGHGVRFYQRSPGCSACNNTGKTRKLRPLAEHFIMTSDLYSQLMAVDQPYEMESILKEHVISRGQNLEVALCQAIEKGIIHVEALDSLI